MLFNVEWPVIVDRWTALASYLPRGKVFNRSSVYWRRNGAIAVCQFISIKEPLPLHFSLLRRRIAVDFSMSFLYLYKIINYTKQQLYSIKSNQISCTANYLVFRVACPVIKYKIEIHKIDAPNSDFDQGKKSYLIISIYFNAFSIKMYNRKGVV